MNRNATYPAHIKNELITQGRLQSYLNTFPVLDDRDLIGVYVWNKHLCAAIYPLIAAAEIALRNSVDSALTKKLGALWWSGSKLQYNSYQPTNPLPYAVDVVRKNFQKAYSQAKRDMRIRYNSKANPTHNQVVANTDLSTWEQIFDAEFFGQVTKPNGTITPLIWPANLGAIFRGAWSTTSTSTFTQQVKDLIKTVREFRNRISHNEPIWKKYGIQNEQQAIAYIHEKIRKIDELITLICPSKRAILAQQNLFENAYRAASIAEIRRFQGREQVHKVTSIRKFKALLRIGRSMENKSLVLSTNKKSFATLTLRS